MINAAFLLCIVILSQAATLIRLAEASSLAICFWRLLFAGAMLAPFAFRAAQRSKLFALNRIELMQLVLSGFFLFTHFYFFFRSVQETSIANCTILFSLNPVTTAIGAWWLFRERVTQRLAIACFFGIAGIAVLFGERWLSSDFHGTQAQLWGDIWGVSSAVCFSGYILTGKRLRQKLSNSTFASLIYFQTAIYAGVAMSATGSTFTHYSPTTWWIFLGLAIFPTLLGHAIFTYCLEFLDINFMSCMTLTEPVLAAISAHFLFHEPLSQYATIGFILTCVSVIALYWKGSPLKS